MGKVSREELVDLYFNQKLSTRQIGAKLGVSYASVQRWFKKYGIKLRGATEGSRLNPAGLSEAGRRRLSENSRKHAKLRWEDPEYRRIMEGKLALAREKIDEDALRRMSERKSFNWINEFRDEIINLYRGGKSMEKIGKRFGISGFVIDKLLKRNNVFVDRDRGIKRIRELEQNKGFLGNRNRQVGRGQIGKFVSDVTKQRLSESHKVLWEDEEFTRRMFKAFQVSPNKPERQVIDIISKHNLSFEFTGDGKRSIGGRIPDFISESQKKIIEVFGRAFHDPDYDRPFIEVRPERTYQMTLDHYEKHGYSCLIIWDEEFKDLKKVAKKIVKFSLG